MDFILNHIKEIMLLFFFAAFLGIAWWAFKPANKKRMKSYGDIPFKEKDDGR